MPDELVTVESYQSLNEANIAKSELAAFGIEAYLKDENAIRLDWLWSNAFGGVKLQVPEEQAAEARELLQAEPAAGDEQEAPAEPPVPCPVCGSADTRYFLDKRGAFLTWLVLGVPVLPARSRRACNSCGHRWSLGHVVSGN
jgi:hypothetical protein